jgi:hypothetical protein
VRRSLLALSAILLLVACEDTSRGVFRVVSVDAQALMVCLHNKDVRDPAENECHPVRQEDLTLLQVGFCGRMTVDAFIPPKRPVRKIQPLATDRCR